MQRELTARTGTLVDSVSGRRLIPRFGVESDNWGSAISEFQVSMRFVAFIDPATCQGVRSTKGPRESSVSRRSLGRHEPASSFSFAFIGRA